MKKLSFYIILLSYLFITLGIFLPGTCLAHSLDYWPSSPPATGNKLYGVTYSPEQGLFLAVGEVGTILTSSDGQTWETQNAGTDIWLGDITSANTFVTVGGYGTVLTSPDGTTWTSATSPNILHLNGVAFGNGVYVAVGVSGVIIKSSNGTTWTTAASGTSNFLQGVTYGNGTFVAVGGSGEILTSPNGTNWTDRSLMAATYFLQAVAYGNSTFVTVGSSGKILTSSDGISWTARDSGTTNSLLGVAYGDNTFAAVGDAGTILTSPDGITWTTRTPSTSARLQGVTHGNNIFVVVGDFGTILTASGAIAINSGAPYTTSDSVTLTLSCHHSDGSACDSSDSMQFSNDEINWSSLDAFNTSKAWTLLSGDGAKTVYAKFLIAGDWTDVFSDSIFLDTNAPTTTASPIGGVYYDPTIYVTLTCDDASGSGCSKIYYTTDGSSPTTSSAVYTAPVGLVDTTPTIKYFAVDKAGLQESEKEQTYIFDPPLFLTTTSLPSGTIGVHYSQPLTAAGGFPPYTWSVLSGVLPGDLSLDRDTGELSGTPTISGTFNFTAQVTDTWSLADTAPLSITIYETLPSVPSGNEDLTLGYYETDSNSHISVTASGAEGTGLTRNESAYVYRDFGANYFDALDINFEMYLSAGSDLAAAGNFGLTVNTVGSTNTWGTSDIRILVNKTGSGEYKFSLVRGGAVAAYQTYVGSANTLYYCSLTRSAGSDTVQLKIYSDANRTTQLDSLSVSGFGTATKYRYLYPLASQNDGKTAAWNGYFQNIAIAGATAPQGPFTLSVVKGGTGSGTVTSSPAGIDCGSVCNADYDAGASVTLTATPDTDSAFTGWSGGGCSGTGTCVVTMNIASSVTAHFDLLSTQYMLSVSKGGTGAGTVTSSPAGIDCGADCSLDYNIGASVTLTATPDTDSAFTGWSGGGCSGTGTCVVTINANTSVTATFNSTLPPAGGQDLTSGYYEADPANHISVTSSVAEGTGLTRNESAYVYRDFGANYFDALDINFEMYLSAGSDLAAAGNFGLTVNTVGSTNTWGTSDIRILVNKTGSGEYKFSLVRGGAVAAYQTYVGSANTLYYCSLTRSAGSDTVQLKIYSDANRTTQLDSLSVSGFGTATKYRYLYPLASQNDGKTAAWNGYFQNITIAGAAAPPPTGAAPLQGSYTLSITKGGTGSGTVTSSPAGIDCGSACTADYDTGASVTLTAVADSGSTFSGWSGDGCSGNGDCTVTMNAGTSVTAIFNSTQPPPSGSEDLTLGYYETDPNSHISVTSAGAEGTGLTRNESAYVYKDFGANYFDALDIDFEMYLSAGSDLAAAGNFGLTVNTIGSTNTWGTADIRILVNKTGSGEYKFSLVRGGAVAAYQTYVGSANTLYYCSLTRSAGSDTVQLKIYSDANRTTQLDSLSVSGFGTATKYRYLYPLASMNDGKTAAWNGYFQNMVLAY